MLLMSILALKYIEDFSGSLQVGIFFSLDKYVLHAVKNRVFV